MYLYPTITSQHGLSSVVCNENFGKDDFNIHEMSQQTDVSIFRTSTSA